jgi:CTP synthase (UTP-ammonia lyase)
LKASGVNPDTGLVEMEIEDHPFLVCNTIQNIKVRLQTHIHFVNFVAAAVKAKKNNFSTSKDSEI